MNNCNWEPPYKWRFFSESWIPEVREDTKDIIDKTLEKTSEVPKYTFEWKEV
jgi:hypothetical protein